MNKKTIDTQDIIDMWRSGDRAALIQTQKEGAKRANERLRALEKAGETGSAGYKAAQYFIGEDKSRFSAASKGLTDDEIYKNTLAINKFLNSETSTISGQKEYKEEIANSLKDAGFFPEDVENKQITKFLESNAWENLKKFVYTKNVMNEVGEALEAGAKVEDLEQAFNDFLASESDNTDVYSVWEEWINATD